MIKEQINQASIHLPLIANLVAQFPQLEELNAFCNPLEGSIGVHCFDHNREALLEGLGRLFGTSGWITFDEYGSKTLGWQKPVLGLDFRIYGAQKLDTPPTGFPVSPSRFPLAIVDVQNYNEADVIASF